MTAQPSGVLIRIPISNAVTCSALHDPVEMITRPFPDYLGTSPGVCASEPTGYQGPRGKEQPVPDREGQCEAVA